MKYVRLFVVCLLGLTHHALAGFKFDGLALLMLKDFDKSDLGHGKLSTERSELSKLLKSRVPKFRNASPDPTAAFISYLTGRFPAHLSVSGKDDERPLLNAAASRGLLFKVMRDQGYQVGHFGEWPLKNVLKDMVDASFLSHKTDEVAAAAIAWINKKKANKEKFFISILWPKSDLTFNIGGRYVANAFTRGAIQTRDGATCKDVKRVKTQPSRYKTCARHIYLTNRRRDVVLLNNVVRVLQGVRNTFVGVASVSGNESPLVDGHAFGGSTFRGLKRSLYDGGVRALFLFGHNTKQFGKAVTTNANLNSVDIFPTYARFAGVEKSALSEDLDGILLLPYWQTGQRAVRVKKQVWEYRYSAPGHCREESPRFAIMDDTGRFKLLVEPGAKWNSPPVRRELYDLQWGTYELTNFVNTSLNDKNDQRNLERIRDFLYDELKPWMKSVMESPGYTQQAKPHYGCEQIYRAGKAGRSVPTGAHKDTPTGIVLILADDTGVSDISHGQRKKSYETDVRFEPRSPGLDSLANQGLVMGHFYSSASVCSPTRASLLTGRYASHRMVKMHSALVTKFNINKKNGVVSYLGSGVKNLTIMTTMFQRNGWMTGHFGKWHLGFSGRKPGHSSYGLDEYQTYAHAVTKDDFDLFKFPSASKKHPRAFDNRDIQFPARSSKLIVDRTIDFIRDRVSRKQKFFVNVWLQNSHAPLNLYLNKKTAEAQAVTNGYSSPNNPFPGIGRETSKLQLKEFLPDQIYRVLLAEQDREIKRLVDYIDSAGIGDNTLIIYTSDNGPETESVYFVGRGSATPYRGKKRSLYEGGIRAPGIVRWKRHIAPGRVLLEPASTLDLYPTLVSIAKLDKSMASDYDTVQGRDLSCSWLGTCNKRENRALIFEWRGEVLDDCLATSARFAVRYGDYKLHYQPKSGKRAALAYSRAELYNVVDDPMESTNLLLTQSGEKSTKELLDTIVAELRAYTQTSDYDISFFPRKTQRNGDRVRAPFLTTRKCRALGKPTKRPSTPQVSDSLVSAIIRA